MSQVENVISVKDLFAELVRKCWLIILCVCIFAVALGGYKYVSSAQKLGENESVETVLTEEEMEVVMQYVLAVKSFESIESHIDNSILLKCDPYNVYCTELQFIIQNEKTAEDLSTIRAAYADYMLFNRLANDVAASNEEYDVRAIKEILETDPYIREQDSDLRTVRLMIYARDEEQSKELADSVKEQLEKYAEKVKGTIGEHEFTLLDENTSPIVKKDIPSLKTTFETNRDLLEEEVSILEGQLGALQMNYATELLGQDGEVEGETEENTAPTVSLKSVLKFAILGAVLGGAVAVVLIVAYYFFSNQIKTEEEIEHVFGIAHMGDCVVNKKGFFDKIAIQLFYKNKNISLEDNIETVVSKITSICNKKEVNEVCFIGEVEVKTEQVLEKIIALLNENNINAVLLKEGSVDNTKLPNDSIILVNLRKTQSTTVEDTVKRFQENGRNICGYVTFS